MAYIKLLPEVQCFATWKCRGGVCENVDPASLGISNHLADDLNGWAEEWDSIYDLTDDPRDPSFSSPSDEKRFWDVGRVLAERLREEIGYRYEIEYSPPCSLA